MRTSIHGRGIVGAMALLAACACEPPAGPSLLVAPTIESAATESNSLNALSAIVTISVKKSDSVAVQFRLTDLSSVSDSITPAAQTIGDSATLVIPVLGLLPGRRSVMRTVAYGAGKTVESEAMEFTTSPLRRIFPHTPRAGSLRRWDSLYSQRLSFIRFD